MGHGDSKKKSPISGRDIDECLANMVPLKIKATIIKSRIEIFRDNYIISLLRNTQIAILNEIRNKRRIS